MFPNQKPMNDGDAGDKPSYDTATQSFRRKGKPFAKKGGKNAGNLRHGNKQLPAAQTPAPPPEV